MESRGFNVRSVERLTGVTHRQLVHWDRTGLIRPSVRQAAGSGSRRVYSFEDLIEIRVVAQLRRLGISLQAVRKAVGYLHRNHDQLRPLASLRFVTDGNKVFSLTDNAGVMEEVTASGQLAAFVVGVGGIVSELEDKVTAITAPREFSIRVRKADYRVVATPDLEVGGFTLEFPEVPGCFSEAENMREARPMAREALEAWFGAGVVVQPGNTAAAAK